MLVIKQWVHLFPADFGNEKLRKKLLAFMRHEEVVKDYASFSSKMVKKLTRFAEGGDYHAPTVGQLFENLKQAPATLLSLQKKNEEKSFVSKILPVNPTRQSEDPVSLYSSLASFVVLSFSPSLFASFLASSSCFLCHIV